MKKIVNRIMKSLTMTTLLFAMAGCGMEKDTEVKPENDVRNDDVFVSSNDVTYKTYEVETFDGLIVKIDETNIVFQEKVEDVLETSLVPSNAEVIAPGRDYVFLSDSNNYYVEDVEDQLFTIAKKDDSLEQAYFNDDEVEYSTDSYSFEYNQASFDVFEDEDTNSVTFSYCKDGVEVAGSNVITFYVVEDEHPDEFLAETVEAIGGNSSEVMELSLSATSEKCYTYIQGGTSDASGLTTLQTLYAIPHGKDVIYVDGFRTIGLDEETEMSIDKDFEQIMQTLVLK